MVTCVACGYPLVEGQPRVTLSPGWGVEGTLHQACWDAMLPYIEKAARMGWESVMKSKGTTKEAPMVYLGPGGDSDD